MIDEDLNTFYVNMAGRKVISPFYFYCNRNAVHSRELFSTVDRDSANTLSWNLRYPVAGVKNFFDFLGSHCGAECSQDITSRSRIAPVFSTIAVNCQKGVELEVMYRETEYVDRDGKIINRFRFVRNPRIRNKDGEYFKYSTYFSWCWEPFPRGKNNVFILESTIERMDSEFCVSGDFNENVHALDRMFMNLIVILNYFLFKGYRVSRTNSNAVGAKYYEILAKKIGKRFINFFKDGENLSNISETVTRFLEEGNMGFPE